MSEPISDLQSVVDLSRFPLQEPGSPEYQAAVDSVRQDLGKDGCSVLRGFLTDSASQALQREADELKQHAHHRTIYTNPYSCDDDESLPKDHPVRTFLERNNAFVATDFIPESSLLLSLYKNSSFQRFVADCLSVGEIHEYADPYAKLVLNVLAAGTQHPWHYDTNEFIVSTLLQSADDGGIFEYCPNIRSPTDENYEGVRGVLSDEERSPVRGLRLQPGDLQIFHGRHSLHRVTKVEGTRPRITGILAYARIPGVVGAVERTRRLFGRVSQEHIDAAAQRTRADGLRD